MSLSRRELLTRGSAAGVGIAFAGSLETLFGAAPAHAAKQTAAEAVGYGPLVPDPAGRLDLPQGFSYRVLSESGRPDSDGLAIASKHDGMAAFPRGGGGVRLVTNHEQDAANDGPRVVGPAGTPTFNPSAFGGTSTIEVDASGAVVSHRVSLAGTQTNCAGGRTPWGTWLTCEETEGTVAGVRHGWVFEVDPLGRHTSAAPITGMGRYAHEAVAVDPATMTAYLTEDASDPFGLFYKFVPTDDSGTPGSYHRGGELFAMHVPGVEDDDLSTVQRVGTTLHGVRWVPVPDPAATSVSVRRQFNHRPYKRSVGGAIVLQGGRTDGLDVTRSQKLEGAWFGDGAVFFVASYSRTGGTDDGAAAHEGQVWKYDPRHETLVLDLVFTGGDTRFDSPDNITVSPYGGGVVLAEDGDGDQLLVGTASNGLPFVLARNALNVGTGDDPEYSEFAGATFSDDGRTLYVNVQSPGLTYAITGPWGNPDPSPLA